MKKYSEKKCIHNKRKYECKDCNKKLICIHNKNKNIVKNVVEVEYVFTIK